MCQLRVCFGILNNISPTTYIRQHEYDDDDRPSWPWPGLANHNDHSTYNNTWTTVLLCILHAIHFTKMVVALHNNMSIV